MFLFIAPCSSACLASAQGKSISLSDPHRLSPGTGTGGDGVQGLRDALTLLFEVSFSELS
jgi:hypothetical protein